MQHIDDSILRFLNSFVGRWHMLDLALVYVQANRLLTGGIFITVLWYLWFQRFATEGDSIHVRQKAVGALCAMIAGLAIARLLAYLLPFRLRPFVDPELHFLAPTGVQSSSLDSWSAFPSDHAVVWFALATGCLLIHRRVGTAVFLYAVFLSVGRVYDGYHHPSDIIGGAAIGVALAGLLNYEPVRTALYAPVLNIQKRRPGVFYALAFIATYETANMFDEVRSIAAVAYNALHA